MKHRVFVALAVMFLIVTIGHVRAQERAHRFDGVTADAAPRPTIAGAGVRVGPFAPDPSSFGATLAGRAREGGNPGGAAVGHRHLPVP